MAFEALLNKPASEQELINQIVYEIQSHYLLNQDKCYFMKLGRVSDTQSQLIWIKEFDDEASLKKFFWDTKYERSLISTKFRKGRFELLCLGFHLSDGFNIWPDRIEYSRPYSFKSNREEELMPPRELVELGFGEITEMVRSSKSNKAM